MKVAVTGNISRIMSSSLEVTDVLEVATYTIQYSKGEGFFLEKVEPLEAHEERVFGVHEEKVEKIFKTYKHIGRSLGTILSGGKGIGKSLFARMIAERAATENMPTIIVDTPYPGISSFIDSIEQEALVLFDEFEKTFAKNNKEGNGETQDSLLGLFDGVSTQKRLYVITCNELRQVNSFMINRPGRFHYHIEFGNPNHDEIIEYLGYKLDKKYTNEIQKVSRFGARVPLNYDSLRAIALELSFGNSFEESIEDLNIVSDSSVKYKLELMLKDGRTLDFGYESTAPFATRCTSYFDSKTHQSMRIQFSMASAVNYEKDITKLSIDGSDIEFQHYENDEDSKIQKALNDVEGAILVLSKIPDIRVGYSSSHV